MDEDAPLPAADTEGLPTRADPDVVSIIGDLEDGRDPALVPVRGLDVCGHCVAGMGMNGPAAAEAVVRIGAKGARVRWLDCATHLSGLADQFVVREGTAVTPEDLLRAMPSED